jgi:hypothetical protein
LSNLIQSSPNHWSISDRSNISKRKGINQPRISLIDIIGWGTGQQGFQIALIDFPIIPHELNGIGKHVGKGVAKDGGGAQKGGRATGNPFVFGRQESFHDPIDKVGPLGVVISGHHTKGFFAVNLDAGGVRSIVATSPDNTFRDIKLLSCNHIAKPLNEIGIQEFISYDQHDLGIRDFGRNFLDMGRTIQDTNFGSFAYVFGDGQVIGTFHKGVTSTKLQSIVEIGNAKGESSPRATFQDFALHGMRRGSTQHVKVVILQAAKAIKGRNRNKFDLVIFSKNSS